jgi:hypothetical protein
VINTRAQVLVEVQQAYYQALAAQAVLKVAQATLDLRRLTLRQVTALAESALRSTVDVSFAQVNVSQAELDLFHAENDATASHARLVRRHGLRSRPAIFAGRRALPPPLDPDVDALIAAGHATSGRTWLRCGSIAIRSTLRGGREETSQSDHQRRRGGRSGAGSGRAGCRKATAPRVST